jgi:signal transduction histidine kinase
MSHEIRTPLNGVVGIASVLARSNLAPAHLEMVQVIESSAVTLERLLSDILDLAKVEAGHLGLEARPMHLGDAARSAAALSRLRADEKGLGLDLDIHPEAERWVLGDEVRVKQILVNLLNNAVKFTERGSVTLAISPAGDRWRMEVRDTGVGFSPEVKARLFERFQQADGSTTRRYGGSGLGLSICHSLAELMGGSLDADSLPGEGAVFRLEIPLADAGPVTARTLPHAA